MTNTIAIAGASGLVGSGLVLSLQSKGWRVVRLVRDGRAGTDAFAWDPGRDLIDRRALENCQAVVNLAGESISQRWTKSARAGIVRSRVASTRLLARECAHAGIPLLVNASATGVYGDRGEEILDETSPCGGGFLADTCVAWEHASHPARDAGVRTVSCRFGVVLSRHGGALPKMLPAYRLGLGGPLGAGRQWMPWVHLVDAIAAIEHAIETPSLEGPLVVVSREPVRQQEFARVLSNRCGRKMRLTTPGWLLKLALGEMADELLLSSQHCRPTLLEKTNFVWSHPGVDDALADLLSGKPCPSGTIRCDPR